MTQKKSWKRLLEKVESSFAEARVNLHAITVLLVKIFEDKDFRSDASVKSFEPLDDYAASDWLDKYITEVNLTFMELRAVLIEFPDERQWQESTIRALYEETLKKTDERTVTPPINRTAWKKRAEELQESLKESEFQCNQLKKIESGNIERLSSRDQEIRQLREDIARLQGRIEELERLHKPELVTA